MGTTLSPYLFFWQASQEIEEKIIEQCKPGHICRLKPSTPEEMRAMDADTRIGMTFSNIITFFIITLTAATLFRSGITNIETLRDAAEALKPLAGNYAYFLFTVGILSSGFLAIPVLAGSAAYVIAEVFGWTGKFHKSKRILYCYNCIHSYWSGHSAFRISSHQSAFLYFPSLCCYISNFDSNGYTHG